MKTLNNSSEELLFDYCLGITSENEAAKAENLIATKAEAAAIHGRLKAALEPLEAVRPESCPEHLEMLLLSGCSHVGCSKSLDKQGELLIQQPAVAD
jgi:anti-sigma-K factor RskA